MKVAIYSKKNCGICDKAKDKLNLFGFQKTQEYESWVKDTWIERDIEGLMNGSTDERWRDFPDQEVLAFIHWKTTEKIPILWIDGECFEYSEAMKFLKKHRKIQKPEPVVLEAPLERKYAV
jgi:hypothetical protein